MADVQRRLEKLEDFRSEYEALNRVRLKGLHELIEEAKLFQASSKEFWRLKAKLKDLLWKKLEPVMSQVLEGEQLAGAKSELAQCPSGRPCRRLSGSGVLGSYHGRRCLYPPASTSLCALPSRPACS